MSDFKKVVTKDGSVTFYNEAAREHYHTLTGAIEEAELKHLAPAKSHVKDGCVVIDFCLGLAYNTIATLAYAKEKQVNDIKVIAFEKDINIIKQLADITLDEKYEFARKLFVDLVENPDTKKEENNYETFEIEKDGVYIKLYLGDAIELISKEDYPKGDIIYFDPFSRGKLPEFWEESVFQDVYDRLNDGAILTTYSCSKVVRRNMEAVGFRVEDGPVVGRKAPGTIAFK